MLQIGPLESNLILTDLKGLTNSNDVKIGSDNCRLGELLGWTDGGITS